MPSDLAYSERGAGGGHGGRRAGGPRPQIVGPNATLIFEVELLAVNAPSAPAPVSNSTAANKGLTPEALAALRKALKAAETAQTNTNKTKP